MHLVTEIGFLELDEKNKYVWINTEEEPEMQFMKTFLGNQPGTENHTFDSRVMPPFNLVTTDI